MILEGEKNNNGNICRNNLELFPELKKYEKLQIIKYPKISNREKKSLDIVQYNLRTPKPYAILTSHKEKQMTFKQIIVLFLCVCFIC